MIKLIDKINISFSEFYLYNQCPYRHLLYKHLNILKEKPSIHSIFGNAIHDTIKFSLDKNEETLKNIQKFKHLFLTNMKKYLENDEIYKDINQFVNQGILILKNLSLKNITKGFQVYSSEERIQERIFDKFFFKGFIDLVLYNPQTNRYIIIDWKTSGEPWDIKKKKKDKFFMYQTMFYKYFWSVKHNIPISNIDCQYIVLNRLKNKKDPDSGFGGIQTFNIDSSNNEILKSLEKLSETIKKIHIEKVFPKVKIYGNEKHGCMFCPLKGRTNIKCNSKYNQYEKILNAYEI